MNKHQIVLSISAFCIAVILFFLPRAVVENDKLVSTGEEQEQDSHLTMISDEVGARISEWRSLYQSTSNSEKKLNFADSLAVSYLKYQNYDSAFWFIDKMEELSKDVLWKYKVVDLMYQAFQQTPNENMAVELAGNLEERINSLLIENPNNNDLRNKLAMTKVISDNPMQGIMELRQILEDDPENLQAIRNLGLLSIKSGQFDKAEERFRTLLSKDASDIEALFYLGVSLVEQKNDEGKKILKNLSENASNPAIQSLAKDYLKK